jgi:hypothetical protein
MWTAASIRRHIFSLPADKPFTTRDCLTYGIRSVVDQTLYRLVKNGTIRRLGRGIFVRDERKKFSAFQIAKLKAEAFGRKIMQHEFVIPTECNCGKTTVEPKLYVNSDTTEICIDGGVTRLNGVSHRKMRLNACKTGQALKALWKMGRNNVDHEVIRRATFHFGRIEREVVTDFIRWLPAWLSDYFLKRSLWHYQRRGIQQLIEAEKKQPKILVRLL